MNSKKSTQFSPVLHGFCAKYNYYIIIEHNSSSYSFSIYCVFSTVTVGLPLSVTPNFETQECQWSWGEAPLPHKVDPNFPKGCITGCETRVALKQMQRDAMKVTAVARGGGSELVILWRLVDRYW